MGIAAIGTNFSFLACKVKASCEKEAKSLDPINKGGKCA